MSVFAVHWVLVSRRTYILYREREYCFFLLIMNSLFDVCPNTDPTLIGLNVILDVGTNGGMPWPNCASYLENVDCVGSLVRGAVGHRLGV